MAMMSGMMGGMGDDRGGFTMPQPPGSSGYDFISGHAEGTAEDVQKLPQTDEWWVVAPQELSDPFGGGDDDEEDDADDYSGALVRFLDRHEEDGRTVRVALSLVAAHVSADYRARTVSGTAELLYRTVLTACLEPLRHPMMNMGGMMGGAMGGNDLRLDDFMARKRRPRRPAVVLLPSNRLARALQPVLASLGCEARVAGRQLARAISTHIWDTVRRGDDATEEFDVPTGGWKVKEPQFSDSPWMQEAEDEQSDDDDDGSDDDDDDEEPCDHGLTRLPPEAPQTGSSHFSADRSPLLRFHTGEPVECNLGPDRGWARGKVIRLFYREEEMPEGFCAAYQVRLDRKGKDRGQLIFCPKDEDGLIRRVDDDDEGSADTDGGVNQSNVGGSNLSGGSTLSEAEEEALEARFDALLESAVARGELCETAKDELTDRIAVLKDRAERIAQIQKEAARLEGSSTAGKTAHKEAKAEGNDAEEEEDDDDDSDEDDCPYHRCGMMKKPTDDASAELRFRVGDVVACHMQHRADWRVGVVLQTWYETPDFPPGACAAYAVALDECGADAVHDESGAISEGRIVTVVPRDEERCCVRASGRIGRRQSLLEALMDACVGGAAHNLMLVVAYTCELQSLIALQRVCTQLRRLATSVQNSWSWLTSVIGRAGVVSAAQRISCAGRRGIPKAWWVVPVGSKSRDTLCWGWRTNLEQAAKRGDAAVVRLIAMVPPHASTPLLRHAAEVNQFAETNKLLQCAAIRGHAAAIDALLECTFVAVDGKGLKEGPPAWRAIAHGRGWAGETEMLGCCCRRRGVRTCDSQTTSTPWISRSHTPLCTDAIGSPVLSFDVDDPAQGKLTREKLDVAAERLLAHGADPMAVGGQMKVTPLFMAALNANCRLLRAFLARGADPRPPIGDGSGNTALSICRLHVEEETNMGAEAVAEFATAIHLLEEGCEVAAQRQCEELHAGLKSALHAICTEAKRDGLLSPALIDRRLAGPRRWKAACPRGRRRPLHTTAS